MRIPQMLSKEEFELFNALLGAFVQPATRNIVLYKETNGRETEYRMMSYSAIGEPSYYETRLVPIYHRDCEPPFDEMLLALVTAGVLQKPRVYLLCDHADPVHEYCPGRVVAEDGTLLGSHCSTTLEWLRLDLRSKLTDCSAVEIIDLIGQEVPERFRV